jgi:predicted Zn-dependent peptidase
VNDGFKRSVQLTWAQYFGRGMSSLMFQEIRELRSLAYYAHGWGIMLPFDSFPESATGFCTMMGTQADKTDVAMATLDNLFEAMPLRENNIAIAKREVINSINNNYPTFRKRGSEVAVDKVQGYVNSPSGYYVKHAKDVQPSDVASFFGEEIKGRPRVTMIIGDKKKLDMRKLQKYGSVVELKEKDIVR